MLRTKPTLRLKLSYSAIIAGLLVAMIAGIYEQDVALARFASARYYAQLAAESVADVDTSTPATPSRPTWYNTENIDLASLQTVNPDVVGWILFENEPISYPILYSGDNSKYLRHTYEGNYAIAGSIFIDGDNHPDFTDTRTIIYGHNMFDDATMFSRLTHQLDVDYRANHRYFQIITTTAVYRYEINSAEVVNPTDSRYTITKQDRAATSTPIIQLSTCYHSNKQRILVSATRVDHYDF